LSESAGLLLGELADWMKIAEPLVEPVGESKPFDGAMVEIAATNGHVLTLMRVVAPFWESDRHRSLADTSMAAPSLKASARKFRAFGDCNVQRWLLRRGTFRRLRRRH